MSVPKLRPLHEEIKRFGLPGTRRSYQRRAMALGACYIIGRGTFVTAEQLIQILESWVAYPPSNIRQPVERRETRPFVSAHRKVQRLLDQWKREAEQKRKNGNKNRSKAMKAYWRDKKRQQR